VTFRKIFMVYNSGLARLTKKLRRFRNIFAMLPKSDVVAAGRLAGASKHKTSDTPTFVCTSSTFGDTRLKIRKKFAVIFFYIYQTFASNLKTIKSSSKWQVLARTRFNRFI